MNGRNRRAQLMSRQCFCGGPNPVFGFKVPALGADESLIHFDNRASAAHRRKIACAHSLSKPVHHEPCALVRNSEHTVNLMSAYALLAGEP